MSAFSRFWIAELLAHDGFKRRNLSSVLPGDYVSMQYRSTAHMKSKYSAATLAQKNWPAKFVRLYDYPRKGSISPNTTNDIGWFFDGTVVSVWKTPREFEAVIDSQNTYTVTVVPTPATALPLGVYDEHKSDTVIVVCARADIRVAVLR